MRGRHLCWEQWHWKTHSMGVDPVRQRLVSVRGLAMRNDHLRITRAHNMMEREAIKWVDRKLSEMMAEFGDSSPASRALGTATC